MTSEKKQGGDGWNMQSDGEGLLGYPGPRIALAYFSAADVTRTYAGLIGRTLAAGGCEVQLCDVTAYTSRHDGFPVAEFDAVLFGFPVFADYAPTVINDWIPTLDGQGKNCGMFFTYGGRTTGYAHFHTKLLLEETGFRVLFSAEFLGRHSFNLGGWNMLPNRPDDADFAVARDFAALAAERFSQESAPAFALQKPFGYHASQKMMKEGAKGGARGWCQPTRIGDECSMCRDCETECPTQAFDADTGLSDPSSCIECLRCVYICPDKVLAVDPRVKAGFAGFLEYYHLTDDIIRRKQSKIITEAWQAAS